MWDKDVSCDAEKMWYDAASNIISVWDSWQPWSVAVFDSIVSADSYDCRQNDDHLTVSLVTLDAVLLVLTLACCGITSIASIPIWLFKDVCMCRLSSMDSDSGQLTKRDKSRLKNAARATVCYWKTIAAWRLSSSSVIIRSGDWWRLKRTWP